MDEFSKILSDKWKKIIESIVVNGYSKKVESVNFFRIDSWYVGYPEIEFCYKVIFNFENGIRFSSDNVYEDEDNWEWLKELESIFTKMFRETTTEEIKINSKVDYMINQGYRFIIQFYPAGFLSEFRNEKLKELGI